MTLTTPGCPLAGMFDALVRNALKTLPGIDVAKDVPNAQMAKLSGTFLTKVFEGPYQNAGKWAVEMKEYVKNKGKELKKMYFSYTTCPKCAKAYGKNYVVLFAQID